MPVNITNRTKAQKLLLVEEMIILAKNLNDNDFVKCLKGLIKLRTRKMTVSNIRKYYDYVHGIMSLVNKEDFIPNIKYKHNDIPPDAEDVSIIEAYSKNSKSNLLSKFQFIKNIQEKYKDAIVIVDCGYTLSFDSPVTYYCCKCRKKYTVSRRSLENRRRACFCNSELNGADGCGLTEDRVSASLQYSGVNAF
jgi:hypothetical protein